MQYDLRPFCKQTPLYYMYMYVDIHTYYIILYSSSRTGRYWMRANKLNSQSQSVFHPTCVFNERNIHTCLVAMCIMWLYLMSWFLVFLVLLMNNFCHKYFLGLLLLLYKVPELNIKLKRMIVLIPTVLKKVRKKIQVA